MATVKQIRFNDEEERTMLVHAEKYGRNFASYVKDLIIRDMESRGSIGGAVSKEDLKEIIREILSEQGIETEDHQEEPTPLDDYESALKDMGIL